MLFQAISALVLVSCTRYKEMTRHTLSLVCGWTNTLPDMDSRWWRFYVGTSSHLNWHCCLWSFQCIYVQMCHHQPEKLNSQILNLRDCMEPSEGLNCGVLWLWYAVLWSCEWLCCDVLCCGVLCWEWLWCGVVSGCGVVWQWVVVVWSEWFWCGVVVLGYVVVWSGEW